MTMGLVHNIIKIHSYQMGTVALDYITVRILYAYTFNEAIQILFLVASFAYYCKLNKMLTIVQALMINNVMT